jgi:ABC-type maltose transport system permease subunit
MNDRYVAVLVTVFVAFYFPTFFGYHLMVFRVNQCLSIEDRIPHSLSLGQWNKVAKKYKAFYPRSILYQLILSWAVTGLVLAIAIVVIRFSDLALGK